MTEIACLIIGFAAASSMHHIAFRQSQFDFFLLLVLSSAAALLGSWLVYLIGWKTEGSWFNTFIGAGVIALSVSFAAEYHDHVRRQKKHTSPNP